MEKITVDKTELLKTLERNRETHRADFLTAQETFRAIVVKTIDDYRDECVRVLDDRMKQAREGGIATLQFHLPRLVTKPEPVDYTDDYDRAIAMLQWEQGDQVMLSEHDFKRYVLNDWEWAEVFASHTQSYNTHA